ncbi:MAG: hypothetical protein QME62_13970, partial [Armatimonadota bacterium]|nr:hypothetical protein [Armatimonadota bacterium]
QVVEVDADRGLFNDNGVISANLVFEYPLLREPKRTRVTLRARDTESTSQVTLYMDKGAKVKAKVTWYFKDGRHVVQDLGETRETYFVLIPPPRESDN